MTVENLEEVISVFGFRAPACAIIFRAPFSALSQLELLVATGTFFQFSIKMEQINKELSVYYFLSH